MCSALRRQKLAEQRDQIGPFADGVAAVHAEDLAYLYNTFGRGTAGLLKALFVKDVIHLSPLQHDKGIGFNQHRTQAVAEGNCFLFG